jgi:hypothetical protein
MGHDITAYIKTKNDSERSEIAYFRISAFDALRRKLFYGTLNGSEDANGGVSGNGSTIKFTRKEIDTAKEGCKYFLNDIDALKEFVLNKYNEKSEQTVKKFEEIITLVFGDQSEPAEIGSEDSIEDIKENLVDIVLFHHKILQAYDDAARTNNIEIEIDFS